MKPITIAAFVILTLSSLKSFSQKLTENKIDDFTKSAIKNTSWETVYATLSTTVYFRISKINASEYFDLKIMDGTDFYIDENEEMLFKLDNGDIVTITNIKYTVTCSGCGSTGIWGTNMEGISVSYRLSSDQIEKLRANKIVKIRIHTSAGYYERDIKERVANKIQKCLALVE